ncbi:hypothetical protein [Paenibacillus sp. Root444D2]|uniref:hypothetical protein n=1 Tax=Paenibacillus sp. Root444D2 TaxID=1736538 RepID=UPI0012E3EF06|nr:hypothetical protein [Paenibacillus sp. Root444D2]
MIKNFEGNPFSRESASPEAMRSGAQSPSSGRGAIFCGERRRYSEFHEDFEGGGGNWYSVTCRGAGSKPPRSVRELSDKL